jgi:CRP/FNR family transcriptional activator FtrB
MRPENLSRSFAELTKLGVRIDGAAVTIVDIATLTEFAQPDPLIDSPHT